MELWALKPETIDEDVRKFHEEHCQNHAYMMRGFYIEGKEIWAKADKISQLIYLELAGKKNKHVLNRLLPRFHRLACDEDIAALAKERGDG